MNRANSVYYKVSLGRLPFALSVWLMNKRAVNLARAILDRCYSGHWSPGKFLLRVSGSPKIPKASSKVGKAIVIQAVTYIGVTRMARVQMPEELLRDAEGSVTIQKVVWNAGKKIEVEVC